MKIIINGVQVAEFIDGGAYVEFQVDDAGENIGPIRAKLTGGPLYINGNSKHSNAIHFMLDNRGKKLILNDPACATEDDGETMPRRIACTDHPDGRQKFREFF